MKFFVQIFHISPNTQKMHTDFCGRNSALLAGITPKDFRSKSKDVLFTPLMSNSKRFSRLTYPAGHMHEIPVILMDLANLYWSSVNCPGSTQKCTELQQLQYFSPGSKQNQLQTHREQAVCLKQ